MPKIIPIGETEFILEANGYSFHICLGTHTSGNYIAIPDWGICSEASDWDDILWNKEQLQNSLNETISKNARIIAIAICKYMTEE